MLKLLLVLFKLLLIILGAALAVWFFRDMGKAKRNWRELRRAEEAKADK